MLWSANMVFRKAAASLLEHRFGLLYHSLCCCVWFATAADTTSLATGFLFGKLFCVATLVGLGEKRCRKKLPLYALGLRHTFVLW